MQGKINIRFVVREVIVRAQLHGDPGGDSEYRRHRVPGCAGEGEGYFGIVVLGLHSGGDGLVRHIMPRRPADDLRRQGGDAGIA